MTREHPIDTDAVSGVADSSDSREKTGPWVADCEGCPLYATGGHPYLLRALAWVHERRGVNHNCWVGQRIRPTDELAADVGTR